MKNITLMDARIGRLIVEANEISQCLKKDYVFSTDKTGDSTNSTYVQVTSKNLKINSKISIASFRNKLITLRKLMYEDPSDLSLTRADEIIRRHEDIKAIHETTSDDKFNENNSQISLNNCSASTKNIEDISKRTVKTAKSEEKCSNTDNGNANFSSSSKQNVSHHNISANGKVSDPTISSNIQLEELMDKGKPREMPRRRSLRAFQALPQPTGSINSKLSEPSLPVFNKAVESKPHLINAAHSDLQIFFKGCALATSVMEENIQENHTDSHLCVKSLQSISDLYETVLFLKKTSIERLTPEFGQKCIQAIANLRLLTFVIPHLRTTDDTVDDNASSLSSDPNSTELVDALNGVVSGLIDLWKALNSSATAVGQDDTQKSLLKLTQQLGYISITSEYPCPLSPKILPEIREEFMNGCDRAMFTKIEASLMVISHHYNFLESEVHEGGEIDDDKIKSSLLFKVFSLVRSSRHLLMIIKQIQEELKSSTPAMDIFGTTTDNLYLHNMNILSASGQMSNHIEALTKSSLQLIPATDVTILTLKRVSKNVSLVEESSRSLSSSYTGDGMDGIMAQDQLEALIDVQTLLDTESMELKNLLLDSLSFGANRGLSKADATSTNLQHSFSLMNRPNGKRVLPATPCSDKQGNHSFGDSKLLKQISQPPSNGPRSFQDQRHCTLDHSDESSAFERTGSRSFRPLEDGANRQRLGMLEEEIRRDPPSIVVPFRRKTNAMAHHNFRHSFIG